MYICEDFAKNILDNNIKKIRIMIQIVFLDSHYIFFAVTNVIAGIILSFVNKYYCE